MCVSVAGTAWQLLHSIGPASALPARWMACAPVRSAASTPVRRCEIASGGADRFRLAAAYAIVRAQAQSGKVKLLAVQARNRVPGLDLPTVAELGFPGLNFEGLVGIIAARSSNLPDAARDRIGADIKAVSKDSLVAERLASTAQLNTPGDSHEFAQSIGEQVKQLADAAKLLGLKPKQ
jgi:hypothetical protein